MNLPVCVAIEEANRYRRKAVRSIVYRPGDVLTVDIQGEGFVYAQLVFRDVMGVRLLNESALDEFWPEYSEPNGWLYEVQQGGWLELERQRPTVHDGFTAFLREFMIVDEVCVNVLCIQPPDIVDLGADPPLTSA